MFGHRTSRQQVLCSFVIVTAFSIALFRLILDFRDKPTSHVIRHRERLKTKKEKSSQRNYQNNDHPEWGVHKLCIIVGYRDAFDELLVFVPHMHDYLNKKKIRHHIIIVNQTDSFRFNRASLINIGFTRTGVKGCDYIAIHDGDLLPLNTNLNYGYPANGPFHVSAPKLHPLYHYESFIGGILLVNNKDFRRLNGMSNRFWGWGKEDDEFYLRIKAQGLKIKRPTNINTGTRTFRHIHNEQKRKRDQNDYFDQIKETFHLDRSTGLNNVQYTLKSEKDAIIGGVSLTVLNVMLKCNVKLTPWCLHRRDHSKYWTQMKPSPNGSRRQPS